MARMSLVPQKREFFALYNRAAENVVAIAEALIALLEQFPQESNVRMRDIKELEHEGDRLTHEIVDLLNRTFVTPFDRDDMYRLAGALDDICDHVDEAAGNVASFGVQRVREKGIAQADVILRAARKLHQAIERLDGFKVEQRALIELRELEEG